MNTLLCIFAGFFLNLVVGMIAIALIDSKDDRLAEWIMSAPIWALAAFAVTIWPVTCFWYWWIIRRYE